MYVNVHELIAGRDRNRLRVKDYPKMYWLTELNDRRSVINFPGIKSLMSNFIPSIVKSFNRMYFVLIKQVGDSELSTGGTSTASLMNKKSYKKKLQVCQKHIITAVWNSCGGVQLTE